MKLDAGSATEQADQVVRKKHKAFGYGIIYISLILFLADSLYRVIGNVNYYNREKCIFYNHSSKIVFLIYESFIELWIVTVFGIFFAVILKKCFEKYGKLYPKGPLSAFLYGSMLPICACSAIPLLTTLKGKLRFRTIIIFVMASPLLSPIIILLSFTVLGTKYTVLRIVCSFVLSVGAGYFLELFYRPEDDTSFDEAFQCKQGCMVIKVGIMDETWNIAKNLLPYMLIAGALSCTFSLFQNGAIGYFVDIVNSWYGILIAVIIGIPLYVCNGADVFFLRPLFTERIVLPYGQAIAFSLSASIVCVPSIVLLSKILGKRLTAILVAYVFVMCLGMGAIIKILFE